MNKHLPSFPIPALLKPTFLIPVLLIAALLAALLLPSLSGAPASPPSACQTQADAFPLPDFDALHREASLRGESPVSFRSSAFERLLRGAMGKRRSEPFYPGELAAIRCLSVSPGRVILSPDAAAQEENAIDSLSMLDLQHFTGLEHLRIMGVKTEDLFILPLLPLTSLSLSFCGLTAESCEPLCGMRSLKSLSLEGNNLKTVNFLIGLCTLENLSLAYNPIGSLAPLVFLSSLRSLSLRSTFPATLDPLRYLNRLEVLDLSMIGMPDRPLSLRPLASLAELHVLHLREAAVSGTEHIAHVPHVCGALL